jgi:hypothetical protein
MPELGSLHEREMQDIRPAGYTIADVARRRDRRHRNQRMGSAIVALIIVAAAIGGLVHAFGSHRSSIPWPTPTGRAAPILREGEIAERTADGQTVVATATTTGRRRTFARCDKPCVFIGTVAPSIDGAWVAYTMTTCGGACTPAKLAGLGIWIVGAVRPRRPPLAGSPSPSIVSIRRAPGCMRRLQTEVTGRFSRTSAQCGS